MEFFVPAQAPSAFVRHGESYLAPTRTAELNVDTIGWTDARRMKAGVCRGRGAASAAARELEGGNGGISNARNRALGCEGERAAGRGRGCVVWIVHMASQVGVAHARRSAATYTKSWCTGSSGSSRVTPSSPRSTSRYDLHQEMAR